MTDEYITPRPTRRIIRELCGDDLLLLSCLHHGLAEVNLKNFKPHLNLDDLVVFSVVSWYNRDKNHQEFVNKIVNKEDPYQLFSYINRLPVGKMYANGFQWLYAKKRISRDMQPKYDPMNPFPGRNLEQRLARVEMEDFEQLKTALIKPTLEYFFEGEYYLEKRRRDGDNSGMVCMGFQNKLHPSTARSKPEREKQYEIMRVNYADETMRILKSYPQYYLPLPTAPEAQEPRPKQLSLF